MEVGVQKSTRVLSSTIYILCEVLGFLRVMHHYLIMQMVGYARLRRITLHSIWSEAYTFSMVWPQTK